MFARKIAMKSPFSLHTSSTITIFPGKTTIFPCKHHHFPHFSYVKSPHFPRRFTGRRRSPRDQPVTCARFQRLSAWRMKITSCSDGRSWRMGLWVFGDSHLRGCTWGHVSPIVFVNPLSWGDCETCRNSIYFNFIIWWDSHPQILAVWYTQ